MARRNNNLLRKVLILENLTHCACTVQQLNQTESVKPAQSILPNPSSLLECIPILARPNQRKDSLKQNDFHHELSSKGCYIFNSMLSSHGRVTFAVQKQLNANILSFFFDNDIDLMGHSRIQIV